MLNRTRVAVVVAVGLACSFPLAVQAASTGTFTTPLTNAFLSVDLNGGDIANNLSPTNGWNEDTTTGGFSADNFGVLWTGWGGNQYSAGDGVQLPSSQSATPVAAATISKTFSVGGSAYYGVTNTPSPVVTATVSINTTTNSSSYGTINGAPSLNSRDRGTPSGANGQNDGDMLRDFVFGPVSGANIQSTNYVQLSLSGLAVGSQYQVAIYSYDPFAAKTNNWSATAPATNANGLTGYWPAANDNTNVFTAPADEQSITNAAGTPAGPALFTLAADSNGTINLYGWGGDGIGGAGDANGENADNTYLNGFQIAKVQALLDGDANGDNKVDLNDLNIVLNHLGVTSSARSDGNFDGAATIDLNDLNEVLNHLGTSQSASLMPSAVPEPASLGLLAAFGILAGVRRRRVFS